MWLIAWRDLQFRRRRFVISVLAVAMVLTITLLLAGLTNFFTAEIDRTVDQFGADAWVASDRATGPFLGSTPVLASAGESVASMPGVESIAGVTFRNLQADDPADTAINLVGVEAHRVGAPSSRQGAPLAGPGEAVTDERLGRSVGDTIEIGGTTFNVVGTLRGSTTLGGSPNVYVTLADAQHAGYADQPIVASFAIKGDPQGSPPSGLRVMSRADAVRDLGRPVKNARGTLGLLSILLWIIAACIIGSIIYLSALERLRDFAVFKATGMSSAWVFGSLVIQAVVLAMIATVLAMLFSIPLAPRFPLPSEVPTSALILLPVTAIAVSVIASLAGVRRALTVDPALAFG